jgi:hypothetical protein
MESFGKLLVFIGMLLGSAAGAHAQGCEGGAYLNPQLFRGEASHQSAVADQEMHAFIGRTGLPSAPLYSIRQITDVTFSGRTPYCWIYANPVIGLQSGYKPVVVNNEPVHPAVLAITAVPAANAQTDAAPVALASLPPAEQRAILDRLKRSRCMGTTAGTEAAIIKAEGICAIVEDVAAQAAIGQQGLYARAAFAWEPDNWSGVATRTGSAMNATMKGLAGRSEQVHQARLVVVPTQATSVGFGLYVHPSVPEATVRKAVAAFQGLTSPSRPLAIALDLGPQYSFVVPTADQVNRMAGAVGLSR